MTLPTCIIFECTYFIILYLNLGVCYIPWSNIDKNTDFVSLEDGGMFDEDTMPIWMKEKIKQNQKLELNDPVVSNYQFFPQIDTSQPPPNALPMIPIVDHFGIGSVPR